MVTALRVEESGAPVWHAASDRIALFIGVLSFVYTVIMLQQAWPFDTDDAYITLRYSRHWADGKGIVWNMGEHPPVEGYSNFLYVLMGAASLRAGLEPIVVFKVCGALALLLTCLGLYKIGRTWMEPLGAVIAPALFVSYRGTIWWAISGLETPVYTLWIVLAVLSFFRGLGYGDARRTVYPRHYSCGAMALAGAFAFLASLTRPEGPVIVIVMGLALGGDVTWHLLGGRTAHGILRRSELLRGVRLGGALLSTFAVPFVIYFAWRWQYFHRMFPNTYYWKKACYTGNHWILLTQFLNLVWLYFFLIAIYPIRQWDVRHGLLACLIGSYGVLLYGVDPIIGHENRHFICVFALMTPYAALGPYAIATRLWPRISLPTRIILVCCLGVVFTLLVCTQFDPGLRASAQRYSKRMEVRRELGVWLNERLNPCDTFVIGDAGLVPYIATSRVIDAYGLNAGEVTRPPISGSVDRFADWILRQDPQCIVVVSESATVLVPHTLYGIYPALVADPRFGRYYRCVGWFGTPGDRFHYWAFEHTVRKRQALRVAG